MSSNGGAGAGSAPSKDNQMESLQEIFRCFICMESLRNPHLCPRCSKLCCYACIRRWLTETRAQCPHCRSSLYPHELVNCRWAEEVTLQLDSLQNSQSSTKKPLTSLSLDMESEKCSTHVREDLSVYCETCKCCICHECALWSEKHANHTFKPLDEIYHQHCLQIKDEASRLRKKAMELYGSITDLEKNVDLVRHSKDQKVREIRNAMELMIGRLDAQLRTKLMALISQKNAVTRKLEEIETLMQSIEGHLSNGPKSDVIKQSSKLVKTIQDTVVQSNFTIPAVPADFLSELVPPYDSATYIVQNYSQLRRKADPFYSDPLNVNGLVWRLKIYPDGNGVVRGTFLSVFLELTSGPAESQKYEYRIEMLCQTSNDPSKSMVREFASDFEKNECWGYNRFFRLDWLESEGYLDPATDTIKLKFEVRNPTYYLKCKDQKWFIDQLLASTSEQGSRIDSLTRRLAELGDVAASFPEANGDASTGENRAPTANACDNSVQALLVECDDNLDSEDIISQSSESMGNGPNEPDNDNMYDVDENDSLIDELSILGWSPDD